MAGPSTTASVTCGTAVVFILVAVVCAIGYGIVSAALVMGIVQEDHPNSELIIMLAGILGVITLLLLWCLIYMCCCNKNGQTGCMGFFGPVNTALPPSRQTVAFPGKIVAMSGGMGTSYSAVPAPAMTQSSMNMGYSRV